MTLIESFDRCPLQNIAECLAILPDRLILVGNDEKLEESAKRYREILEDRHISIPVIPKQISCTAFDDVKAAFEELIRQYSPCAIDLFGGDEVQLVAAGAAYHQLRERYDVSLQKMDMEQRAVVRIDGDEPLVLSQQPQLTIKESVAIYGGSVFSEETKRLKGYTAADINPLWDIARKAPGEWNKKLKALNFFEKRNGCHGEDLDAFVNLYCDCGNITDVDAKRSDFREIIKELEEAEAITVQWKKRGFYRYRYRNNLVRSCLKKEGNVLEYKTCLTARECEVDGKRLFNDCAMGVMLDWDGKLHNSHGPSPQDTRNEIDIMAMNGAVPVFISCKNGTIEDEELYKLKTVAMQLGGEFSKKVLVATNFEPPGENAKETLIRRAKDMDVTFATDVATFSEQDWVRFFEKIVKGHN